MTARYIARDPRTGKPIQQGKHSQELDIRSLLPDGDAWQRIPIIEILPLAAGEVETVQLPLEEGGGFVKRADAIRALHRVYENALPRAHSILLDALDDDSSVIRIAGLDTIPIFSLKMHTGLIQCLADRLLDESAGVRAMARRSLLKIAPIFPSGCEDILRRELRDDRSDHRTNAFETLRQTAIAWPETGCLHLDELLREDEVDLRRRGSKILRTIAAKGGAEGWDLIGWALEDVDAQVRRNSAQCLMTLANTEPRIAMILVESAILDEDNGVRSSVIRALKRLDMQNPRVTQLILDGARSRDINLRRACIDQLSIILSGDKLREAAGELLRHETAPDLVKRLKALSRDVDWEGTEEEKNRSLAALPAMKDNLEENALDLPNQNLIPEKGEKNQPLPPRSGVGEQKGEYDKQRAGRREPEDLQ